MSGVPELDGLMQLLKDGPSRVAAVAVVKSSPSSLVIRFSECQTGYDQAPVIGYMVEYEQTSPHEINPDYVRTKSVLVPMDTPLEICEHRSSNGTVYARKVFEAKISEHQSNANYELLQEMIDMEDTNGGVGTRRTRNCVQWSDYGYTIEGLTADVREK